MTHFSTIPPESLERLTTVSESLGYKGKRKDSRISRWKLFDRLLEYAKAHPEIFGIWVNPKEPSDKLLILEKENKRYKEMLDQLLSNKEISNNEWANIRREFNELSQLNI